MNIQILDAETTAKLPFWDFRMQAARRMEGSFLGHQTRQRGTPKPFDICGGSIKPVHPRVKATV